MTKYSRIILDIINNSYEHPTAEQIFLKAKEKEPKVVLATVYNNLNSLVSDGYIRKIVLPGTPDRYDKIKRHDHMYCVKCGKIVDIKFENLTEKLEKNVGMKIISYDLNIQYICPECREKQQ